MYRLTLELTKKCNLACKYCFVKHEEKEMSKEQAKRAIEYGVTRALAMKKKGIGITFFGGEPILKLELIKMITDYAISITKENGLQVSFDLTTNGTLLSKDILDYFSKNKFLLKVSIDGDAISHDLNRKTHSGNNTYSMILNNRASLLEYQNNVKNSMQISMVISKNTYKRFFLNFKHIVDLGFTWIDTVINAYENWTNEELMELEGEIQKGIDLVLENACEGKCISWSFLDYGVATIVKPMKNYYCGAGVNSSFVTTDGNIFPCTACTMKMVNIGNVYDGYYKDKYNRYVEYKRSLSENCNNCEIQKNCPACDCILLNYEITREFNKVPFAICCWSKMRIKLSEKMINSPKLKYVIKKLNEEGKHDIQMGRKCSNSES